jgi:translation initiation factor IF-3
MKQARKFLEEGDKVKVTLRFRGREMSHLQLGIACPMPPTILNTSY